MGPRLRGPRDAGVAGCPSRGQPDGCTLASFGQKAARALLRMRTGERVRKCGSSLNRSLESQLPMSNSPSRSRGAFLRPGFATLLRSPESRGGRSAEGRSDATPRSAFRIVSRRRPSMSEAGEPYSLASHRSQQLNAACSRQFSQDTRQRPRIARCRPAETCRQSLISIWRPQAPPRR